MALARKLGGRAKRRAQPASQRPDAESAAEACAARFQASATRLQRQQHPVAAATAADYSPPKLRREFKLPELGENISQGDLVRLMISPGTKVSEGQPVMELETDKAVVEVPSSVSGVVKEIKVKEGEKIKVGQVIFTLEGGAAGASRTTRKHAPVEHVSGQHGARLAFQAAIRAEGKTEEQALPPDQPHRAPSFQHAGATGQSRGHRTSRSRFLRLLMFAVWRAKSASTFMK